MTTVEELCQWLVYVSRERPLSDWPEHRRAQFLRLVDTRLPRDLVRAEMQTLAMYLFSLSKTDDPAREVQRLARSRHLLAGLPLGDEA